MLNNARLPQHGNGSSTAAWLAEQAAPAPPAALGGWWTPAQLAAMVDAAWAVLPRVRPDLVLPPPNATGRQSATAEGKLPG